MRRLLMIALAGMTSLAFAGAEASAGNGFGHRGVGFGNGFSGRQVGYSSFRGNGFSNFRGNGYSNFRGYNNSFYRGSGFQGQFRNPYQSIPRPNPYYGGGRSFYGGGFGGGGFGGGFGGGCRR